MKAKLLHPQDGTDLAGRPIGEWKEIEEIMDHRPVDGQRTRKTIVLFKDGTWAFIWNCYFE